MSIELTDIQVNQIAQALVEKLDRHGMILTPQQAEDYKELCRLREEEENTWLTAKAAADYMGLSRATVGRAVTAGKLEFTIMGKVPKFSIAGLKRYMRRYNVHPTVKGVN